MFPTDEEISHAKWLEARAILDTNIIERLAKRIKDVTEHFTANRSELKCGASLAHHGLLGSVNSMFLIDVDLSLVPAQHLASLASCVTRCLHIENVSGCDLVSILSSLKCRDLDIFR